MTAEKEDGPSDSCPLCGKDAFLNAKRSDLREGRRERSGRWKGQSKELT
jgi:hypothetical protein